MEPGWETGRRWQRSGGSAWTSSNAVTRTASSAGSRPVPPPTPTGSCCPRRGGSGTRTGAGHGFDQSGGAVLLRLADRLGQLIARHRGPAPDVQLLGELQQLTLRRFRQVLRRHVVGGRLTGGLGHGLLGTAAATGAGRLDAGP